MSENFTKNLPPEFVRNVVGVCGETGARWLHDLPRIVAEIAAEWSLEVRVHFPNLSYNFAAPCVCKNGCEAVLKIGFPETVPVIFGEAAFLRAADGDGTVRLLQFDRERRALLLERLSPGEELKRVCETDDERATRIAVKLLKRIHSRMRLTDGFPSLESWTDGFRKAAKPHFAASFVEKARVYFIELGAASGERRLLHGDFHHQNILSTRGGQFLAIDPKAIVGDIGYEIAVFLNNPRGWLLSRPDRLALAQRRVEIFAEAFAIEPQNLRKWAYAEAVLSAWWTIEDGGSGAEKWLACAEIWEN
jgi:streptomycin 6-kinase